MFIDILLRPLDWFDQKKMAEIHNKFPFTKDDIENIPGLKDLMESIKQVQIEAKNATGMKRYKLNQQVMEMQSDQYELKKMFIKPVHFINIKKSMIY